MADNDKPQVSLADIMNVDVNDVAELRFSTLPKMTGVFKISDAKTDTLGEKETATIIVECEVAAVGQVLANSDGTMPSQDDLVGQKHRETFFIREVRDIGRFKAFLADAGIHINAPMPLQQMLAEIAKSGWTFNGKITHRPDKNDKEKFYANVVPVVMKANAAAVGNAVPPPAVAPVVSGSPTPGVMATPAAATTAPAVQVTTPPAA